MQNEKCFGVKRTTAVLLMFSTLLVIGAVLVLHPQFPWGVPPAEEGILGLRAHPQFNGSMLALALEDPVWILDTNSGDVYYLTKNHVCLTSLDDYGTFMSGEPVIIRGSDWTRTDTYETEFLMFEVDTIVSVTP